MQHLSFHERVPQSIHNSKILERTASIRTSISVSSYPFWKLSYPEAPLACRLFSSDYGQCRFTP